MRWDGEDLRARRGGCQFHLLLLGKRNAGIILVFYVQSLQESPPPRPSSHRRIAPPRQAGRGLAPPRA